MTGARSPAAALSGIPGWEHATWTPMAGGLTNHVWLVEAGNRKGVLKIDDAIRGTPFGDRRFEARVQQAAAGRGLAARVLYCTETTYLTEFVEGVAWSRRKFSDEREFIEIARAIKQVHSLPLTGRVFDAVSAATVYLKRIKDADMERASAHFETLRAASWQGELRCCHNDLVAENIIDTKPLVPNGAKNIGAKHDLLFVDWEYACDNDPMFDLATLIAHHGLSASQADVLLDAYADGDRRDYEERLAEQTRLYESLCWLWRRSRP